MSLVYRKDQINNKIYRMYLLQKVPNTLLLVKTEKGTVIGGFSSLSYCHSLDEKTATRGLLFSLYAKVAYPLKKNENTPVKKYTDRIIFGNDEIIIDEK